MAQAVGFGSHRRSSSPAGAASGSFSGKNISGVVRNPLFLQKANYFLLKTPPAVMCFLVQDVPLHLFHLRLTHAERRVAGLPAKVPTVLPAALNPTGRIRLHLSHQRRKGKRRWLNEEHVNMIGGTVHQ